MSVTISDGTGFSPRNRSWTAYGSARLWPCGSWRFGIEQESCLRPPCMATLRYMLFVVLGKVWQAMPRSPQSPRLPRGALSSVAKYPLTNAGTGALAYGLSYSGSLPKRQAFQAPCSKLLRLKWMAIATRTVGAEAVVVKAPEGL